MAYKAIKPFENILTNFGSTMAYKVIKPFENIMTNFGFVMLHSTISNACHSRLSLAILYQALFIYLTSRCQNIGKFFYRHDKI
jgi:hypothetical protein